MKDDPRGWTRRQFLWASAILGGNPAFAREELLPPAVDFIADGKLAIETRQPVIVLVSLEGCPYCDQVRRSHLLPLRRLPEANVIVRQVELRRNMPLIDFDGKKSTHAQFASRHKARIAPVVLFLDGRGNALAEPLVGASIPDFYGVYFETALAQARAALQPPQS